MRTQLLLPLLLGIAIPALAQAPQGAPTRIRGTIEKFDGHILVIAARGGATVTATLASHFAICGVVRKSLADIKPGDYVASTSVRGTDGRLHALEIHIFPEALRGVGEGRRPWDLEPGSLMTNATVAQVTSAPEGTCSTLPTREAMPM